MDWMKAATESVKSELAFRLELTGSFEEAILQAINATTAGCGAWEIALRETGWMV